MPADIARGNRKFGNIFNAKRAFLLIIMAIADTLLIPNAKKSGMQVATQVACLEMGKTADENFQSFELRSSFAQPPFRRQGVTDGYRLASSAL